MSRSKSKPQAKPAPAKRKAAAKPKAAARGMSAADRRAPGDDAAAGQVPEPGTIHQVALDLIRPSPHNPRRSMDEGELDGLAASIREHGLLQPLIVSHEAGKGFDLIAGHRRLAAVRKLGWSTVACLVRAPVDSATARALQIIENLQRADVAPMDEARAFADLQAEDPERWTHAAIGRAIGKSDRFVAQRIALALHLAPELQEQVAAGTLKIEVARTLAGAPATLQKKVAGDSWARGSAVVARQRLEQLAVPVGTNAFRLALYDGPFLEPEPDEDGPGTAYFADVAQFDRLQKAEAERQVEALRTRKGFPGAKLVTWSEANGYRWADDGQWPRYNHRPNGVRPADRHTGLDVEDVTAIVYLDRHELVVAKGVVTKEAWDAKALAAAADDDSADDTEPGPTPAEKRAAIEALTAQWIERLAGRASLARRLFVHSHLGSAAFCETNHDDAVAAAIAPWRAALEDLVTFDEDASIVELYDPAPQAEDALWTRLLALDEATIDAMLARLMATRLALDPWSSPRSLHRAIAAEIGVEIPAFLLPAPEPEVDRETEVELPGFPADEAA